MDWLAASLSVKLTNCSEEAFLLLISPLLGKFVKFTVFLFDLIFLFHMFCVLTTEGVSLLFLNCELKQSASCNLDYLEQI